MFSFHFHLRYVLSLSPSNRLWKINNYAERSPARWIQSYSRKYFVLIKCLLHHHLTNFFISFKYSEFSSRTIQTQCEIKNVYFLQMKIQLKIEDFLSLYFFPIFLIHSLACLFPSFELELDTKSFQILI